MGQAAKYCQYRQKREAQLYYNSRKSQKITPGGKGKDAPHETGARVSTTQFTTTHWATEVANHIKFQSKIFEKKFEKIFCDFNEYI